eukprot:5825541-Prymnesium_polylepis.1
MWPPPPAMWPPPPSARRPPPAQSASAGESGLLAFHWPSCATVPSGLVYFPHLPENPKGATNQRGAGGRAQGSGSCCGCGGALGSRGRERGLQEGTAPPRWTAVAWGAQGRGAGFDSAAGPPFALAVDKVTLVDDATRVRVLGTPRLLALRA